MWCLVSGDYLGNFSICWDVCSTLVYSIIKLVFPLFFIDFLALFAVSEAIFVITSAIKDVCGKPPTERLFLDKYGKICLCLDEIVWTVR